MNELDISKRRHLSGRSDRRHAFRCAAAVTAVIALAGCAPNGDAGGRSSAVLDGPITLLSQQETTVLGQPVVYPSGTAQVSSVVITLAPGDETGWHRHEAPLFGYILQGTLTVDYGDDGERTYQEGEALMEAVGTVHNGRAVGDVPTRILVVNVGSDEVENTVTE